MYTQYVGTGDIYIHCLLSYNSWAQLDLSFNSECNGLSFHQKPDGKKPSITTKLVLYVIWTKLHKTEPGGIASL